MRLLKEQGGRWSLLALVGLVGALLLAGCASTKKVDEFPETVEAEVEAEPTEPDRIDFIQVEPWEIGPGETASVTVKGTAERSVEVMLEGVSGEAEGAETSVDLSAEPEGRYVGEVSAEGLAPGRYRIEAQMSGGPSAEPATLVSSRSLLVTAPPEVTACEEVQQELTEPGIYFAFDKSDITDDAMAYIRDLAADLREAGDSVKGIKIEGHCDERGTIEYNLALGARRAAAVRKALQSLPGMDSLAVETVSRGEEQPVIPDAKTEAQHAKNRRAEITLHCR
jgi:outer membrane protein OmpA-like peptidoglycan-associated protein